MKLYQLSNTLAMAQTKDVINIDKFTSVRVCGGEIRVCCGEIREIRVNYEGDISID